MALLGRGDGREHGIDSILRLDRVAGHVEVHEGGVAVLGDRALAAKRRLHVLDVRDLRQVRVTSSTAALNCGSLMVSLSLWMNTTSD